MLEERGARILGRFKRKVRRGRGTSGSGSEPSILAEAVGAWHASNYVTTPRRAIPNSITNPSAMMDPNVMVAPRRCFSTARFSQLNVTSRTDNNAVAPDGSTEASTITRASTSAVWQIWISVALTAGQYTVALSVRNVSGDANFRLQCDTISGVKTATSSWGRFEFTATVTAGSKSIAFLAPAAGTIASFEICDLELFSGAADLNTTWATLKPLKVRNADFDIGIHGNNQTTGSCTAGVININSVGTLPLPAIKAMGPYTFLYVASKNAGGVDNVGQGMFSNLTTGASLAFSQRYATYFGLYQGTSHLLPAYNGASAGTTGLQSIDSLVGRNNVKPVIVSASYSGTVSEGYVNGVRLLGETSTATAQNIGDLQLIASPMYDIHCYAYFDRVLTEAEQLTVYNELNAIYATPSSSIVVFEGDSITEGVGASTGNGWPYVAAMSMTESIFGINNGLAASVTVNATPTAGLTGRASRLDQMLVNKGSRKAVLTVLIGANDLANATRDTWLTNLYAYLDARRAAGWYVGLCTLLPRTPASGGDAAFLTARAYVNPLLVASVGTHCDFIIDFAADATMGPDAAASDTALYGDGVHPTTLGHANLAAIAYPRIEANIP